jgi:amino-acid N-acetyltransferase
LLAADFASANIPAICDEQVKLTDLRTILQYIPGFREKIFVISVDAAIVTSENFPNILLDVAVLRSLSIRVVLVHGAAAQMALLARELNIQPSNLDGSGVTDAPTLKLALTAANRLTHEILEGLSACDLRAACCNALIAHPMGIIHGQDHLFTGKVERVDVEMLQGLLAQGIIPVVPPLGFDGDGKTYRVNSDTVALELAKSLNAAKLIYVTALDGLIYEGKVIPQILVAELSALLAQNKAGFAPEIASKAQCASAACAAGVSRAHVINGRIDEALLAEVFSNEGIGTLVYANEYQQIRRAIKKDIRAILDLTKNSVESEELVKRTRAHLEKTLGDFYIFETDKNPVACVALHVLDQTKGELACLYVSPSHENQGIGQKLIAFVESKARELGLSELVTLSTQAFTYFQSKGGFSEGSPEDLPPARRERYEQSGRNSKVLIKKLAPK